MILGVLVLGTGLVLRFALKNESIAFDASALCLIGVSLSLEYQGEKYRILVRVLQILAGLVVVANVLSWFLALPDPASIVIRLVAIAVNVPLAALGLKKNEKS